MFPMKDLSLVLLSLLSVFTGRIIDLIFPSDVEITFSGNGIFAIISTYNIYSFLLVAIPITVWSIIFIYGLYRFISNGKNIKWSKNVLLLLAMTISGLGLLVLIQALILEF